MLRVWLLVAVPASLGAQVAVTTAQYDNQRTGANLRETLLTPRNVREGSFGRLFSWPVDGEAYAQPLFVPRVAVPGRGALDLVFIATEYDSVYAFDASSPGAQPVWKVSFLNRAAGVRPSSPSDVGCPFIAPDLGITATPAIDLETQTIYVVVRTTERGPWGRELLYQRLHALDVSTGAERPGSPLLVRARVERPRWLGLFSREVTFNAAMENPRAAILVSRGTVYIAWGSSCDVHPYFGWVLAYDARTLRQTGVFNTAPDAGEGGIWQSDTGIAADLEGNVYAVTGNGQFTAAAGGRDYGDSVLKLGLSGNGLSVRDYFTPHDEARLNNADVDLGSSGPVVLPDQPGGRPHLLVTAGKAGVAYLIDRDRMGGFRPGADTHAVATAAIARAGVYGAPAFWNGHLYFFGAKESLTDYSIATGSFVMTHRSAETFGNPGAIPSVSANGAKDGIVWVMLTKTNRDREKQIGGTLNAYDAEDVSHTLYSTSPGAAPRFSMPTVANGRVYVAAGGAIQVYGLIAAPPPVTTQRRRR